MPGERETYVEPYVKSDGTRVSGYYRHSREGEGGGSRGGSGGSGRGSGPGDAGHGGHAPDARTSPSREWSELPVEWRDSAGRAKPPRGGIDPGELAGNALFEVSGETIRLTLTMPSPAPEHPTVEELSVRMSDPATQEMLVATYKRGQVSRTRNQRKWLAAEMSAEDRENIARDYDESVIQSQKVVHMSKHLKDKIARGELSVPQDVVEETLRSFGDSFLEYNVTEYRGRESRRVLLRNNDVKRRVRVRGREQDANLCLVLDIDTCCMITAYWNAADDHHDTLNRNRYERRDGRGRPQGTDRGNGRRDDGRGGSQGSPRQDNRREPPAQATTSQGQGGDADHADGAPGGNGAGHKRRRRRRRRRRSGNGQQRQQSQPQEAPTT